jgi:hypothetical protein
MSKKKVFAFILIITIAILVSLTTILQPEWLF